MSATSLNKAAGARTRLALMIASVVMAVVIIAFAGLVGYIAMPALAGLLMLVGFRTIRTADLQSVWKTGATQKAVLSVTFALTIIIPLQYAVLVGVGLSVILHTARQSNQITVKRWLVNPDGTLIETDPPAELPAGEVVVLQPYGSLFFAAAQAFEARCRRSPTPRATQSSSSGCGGAPTSGPPSRACSSGTLAGWSPSAASLSSSRPANRSGTASRDRGHRRGGPREHLRRQRADRRHAETRPRGRHGLDTEGGSRMTEGALGSGPLRAGSPLRTPRAAAVAGIIFSALMITALVLLRVSAPAHSADAGAWLTDPERRAGVADRAEPCPVRRNRLLVVHRRAAGPDRRARGPLLRDGVPRQRTVVRRDAVRRRGRLRRPHRERVVQPAGWEHPGAGPQHHLQPAERLRDADGGGVHAHHGDHRPAHRDRVPVAHAGRAGLRAGAAGRRRDLAMGGAAVPRVDPGAEPGHPGGWPGGPRHPRGGARNEVGVLHLTTGH